MTINDTTRRLLDHLHRGGSYGYYWLVSTARNEHDQPVEKKTIWHTADKVPALPAEQNGHGPRHLYYGVHPVLEIPKERKNRAGEIYKPRPEQVRPVIEEIAAISCLYGDFDAKDFDGDKDAAYWQMEGVAVRASVAVDSGGGYQGYWLLNEPFILDTPAKRDRAKRLQERWVAFIGADASVTDLPRVLRLPDTRNWKYDPAPVAQFVYADFERLYTIDELEALLPPEPAKEVYTPRTAAAVPQSSHLKRWVDEVLERACTGVLTAPSGTGSDTRVEMGRLAGGIVHTGVYSENEIIDRLMPYAVQRSSDSLKETERNLLNGLEYGKASPLPIPEFPTAQPLIAKQGAAHCPACDSSVRRSKFDYPGTNEAGWYCPKCRGVMQWPADAWQPEFTPLGPAVPSGLKQERNTSETPAEQVKQTLIHADQLRDLTPTRWLIPGVLPTNKLSLVFGPPGQGKSFVLLDIALTVAQFANVIYIAAEDAEDYEDRKEAWKTHHGLSASGLYFWPEPLRLRDLDAVDSFITQAMALRPALIILDPLADCMRGLNERDEEGMGAAVEALNRIRRATEAAVLILHHTGWSTEHERGSSLLRGAARVVSKIMMNEDDLITMSCEKINGGKKFDKKFFRLVSSGSGVVPLPASRVTSSGSQITDKQVDILEFLALTINKDGVRHTDIVKHFDMAAATVTRTLNKFLEQKLVIKRKKGQSDLYFLEGEGRLIVDEREDGSRVEEGRNSSETRGSRLNWQVETEALSEDVKAFHAPQGDVPSRYRTLDGYEESGTAVEQGENDLFPDPAPSAGSSTETPDSNALDDTSSTVFHASSALPHDPAFVPSAPPPYIRGGAEQGTEQEDESNYSYTGERLPTGEQLWRIYGDRTDEEVDRVATEQQAIDWIKEREKQERGEV